MIQIGKLNDAERPPYVVILCWRLTPASCSIWAGPLLHTVYCSLGWRYVRA